MQSQEKKALLRIYVVFQFIRNKIDTWKLRYLLYQNRKNHHYYGTDFAYLARLRKSDFIDVGAPKYVEELFRQVCKDYNLDGWSIHWCGDPWCELPERIIHLKLCPTFSDSSQILLHEMAHAILGRRGRDSEFWALSEHLCWKYLKSLLNQRYREMRALYTCKLTNWMIQNLG